MDGSRSYEELILVSQVPVHTGPPLPVARSLHGQQPVQCCCRQEIGICTSRLGSRFVSFSLFYLSQLGSRLFSFVLYTFLNWVADFLFPFPPPLIRLTVKCLQACPENGVDIVPGRHIPEDSLPDPNPSAFDWGPSELVDQKEVSIICICTCICILRWQRGVDLWTSSVFSFKFVLVFQGIKEGCNAWTGSSSDGLFLRRAGQLGKP